MFLKALHVGDYKAFQNEILGEFCCKFTYHFEQVLYDYKSKAL